MYHQKIKHNSLGVSCLCVAALMLGPDFANAAPVWSTPPVLLTPATNLDGISGQKVAINGTGQIVSAWAQGLTIQAKARVSGKWGTAVTLATAAAGSNLNVLDLAESRLGEAVALFSVTPTGAVQSTYFSFLTAGKWSAPQTFPASAGATVLNARVSYDGKTTPTATLFWVEKTGTSCSVKTATGKATTGWGAVANIAGPDSNSCYNFIQLAVNPRGEAAVALGATPMPVRGSRAGSPEVVTSRNIAGVWTSLVNLGGGAYATPPSVAIPNNGAAIVLFSDANLGVQWSRRSTTDGSWSAPVSLDGAVPAVPTSIAMAANGSAVAVYNSYYTNVPPASLTAATLPAGSNAWSAPVTISDPSGTIDNFQVTATPAGSIVVGWVDTAPTTPVGASSNMGVSVLPSGTVAWSTTILDSDMSGSFTVPSPYATAVSAAAGRAVAVWNNLDATTFTYNLLKVSTTSVK